MDRKPPLLSSMLNVIKWFRARLLPETVLTAILILGVAYIGGWFLLRPYPIHLYYPSCNEGRVTFSPDLSPRYQEQIRGHFANFEVPYAIMGDRIYTSDEGGNFDNIDKQIRLLANPDRQGLRTLKDRDRSTHELFRRWEAMEDGYKKRHAWCLVVEAVVTRTGVDEEARREHPEIWSPEK